MQARALVKRPPTAALLVFTTTATFAARFELLGLALERTHDQSSARFRGIINCLPCILRTSFVYYGS